MILDFQTNIALQQIVEAWQNAPKQNEGQETQDVKEPTRGRERNTLSISLDERRSTAEAFLSASQTGDVPTVTRMVRKYGRVLFSERCKDDIGSNGLHLAVRYGHAHLVKTMLKLDAWIGTPDNKDNTALHYAARYGQNDITNLLVDSGYEVDVLGEYCRTPMLTAAAFGHSSVVRILLKRGADVFAVDMHGATAALLACWGDSVFVLHELVLFGADFTQCDKFGNFPLFVAAAKGNVEIVAMLLNTEAGLLVDQKGPDDQTALHAAAAFGNIEVAKLLLLNQASVTRDRFGMTPFDLAEHKGHLKFVETISEFVKGSGYSLSDPELDGSLVSPEWNPVYPDEAFSWCLKPAA